MSLPRRYSRLVLNSTRLEQPRRWDVTQIGDELDRLRDALGKPFGVKSAVLLAEEVGARAFPGTYRWDHDRFAVVQQLTAEAKVLIVGNESAWAVELVIDWKDSGAHRRAGTKPWAEDVLRKATAILAKAKWSVRSRRATGHELSLEASISTDDLAGQIAKAAVAATKVNELLIRQ